MDDASPIMVAELSLMKNGLLMQKMVADAEDGCYAAEEKSSSAAKMPKMVADANYAVAECCVINCVRNGLNLVPYKYIAHRQWSPALESKPKKVSLSPQSSSGCSPSLSGAIRVNPWNVDDVAEAMNLAITIPESGSNFEPTSLLSPISTAATSGFKAMAGPTARTRVGVVLLLFFSITKSPHTTNFIPCSFALLVMQRSWAPL